jgi:hypothetical protein
MTDIKFIGDFFGFMFEVDGLAHEVNMTAAGVMVLKEPDITVGQYDTWEEFEIAHPEFAGVIHKVIQRKMNETIDMINQVRYEQELIGMLSTQNLPVDDVMYMRSYQ